MAGIVLEKGKTIYSYGQPMTALHLITNGKVDVSYPGGSYTLGKGDVISICEVCSEIHLSSSWLKRRDNIAFILIFTVKVTPF